MEISFYDDLNLDRLHTQVLSIVSSTVSNRRQIEETLAVYKVIATRSLNPQDVYMAREKIYQLERQLDTVVLTDFNMSTSPIMSEYNSISGRSTIFGIDKCACIPQRVHIIQRYLHTISRYIDIRWSCTYDLSMVCEHCFNRMKKYGPILECPHCGNCFTVSSVKGLIYEDGDIKKPTTYKSSKNFRKEYLHICGIMTNASADEIIDIDYYLYTLNIYDITRDDIRMAIPACNYSNYNDTNYIFSAITKQPLPPLYQYLELCTEKFNYYHDIFKSIITDLDGTNVTNLSMLIRLFLWQEGKQYDKSWFKSLSDSTTLKRGKDAEKVCSILQRKFPNMNWKCPSNWLEL